MPYPNIVGKEAVCTVRLNAEVSEGKAHCGDGELSFKGEFRFRWLWRELQSVRAEDGSLLVMRGADSAEFQLGELAGKWLHDIQNPKSRLDKLGLKPGHRYALWGDFDSQFPAEAFERAGEPAKGKDLDAVFVRAHSLDDLPLLSKARAVIKPNGMIWVVWTKGRKEFREDDVRNYALANGLVDVKVASFSSELSALKLVIPVALR
jgi:hypothetical protein